MVKNSSFNISSKWSHLLQFSKNLSLEEKQKLYSQLYALNEPFYEEQKQWIKKEKKKKENPDIQPLDTFYSSGNRYLQSVGENLLKKNKVGCLIVAGGQASRLGYTQPKGFFPISVIQSKSLFQIFAEKTLAASRLYQTPLPLAIMTSPENHLETMEYFQKNHYFGLDSNQVDFFSQKSIPLLDEKLEYFLTSPYKIAFGADGNGSSLFEFYWSPIWKKWKKQKIQYVNFLQIDNPLGDPFDSELIGLASEKKLDIAIKSTLRENEEEKVGIVVVQEEKIKVIEYAEIPKKEFQKRNTDGSLKYSIANLSMFCFSFSFIENINQNDAEKMPWHAAKKQIYRLDRNETSQHLKKVFAWKLEKFIFDVLNFSLNTAVILYPRNECFAPLKNANGRDSVKTVQKSLLERDRQIYKKISQIDVSKKTFELSFDFYYPNPEVVSKWHGRLLPVEGYISFHQ